MECGQTTNLLSRPKQMGMWDNAHITSTNSTSAANACIVNLYREYSLLQYVTHRHIASREWGGRVQ